MKFLFILSGILLSFSRQSLAIQYEVVVPGKGVLVTGSQQVDLRKHSVGAVTHHLLSYHQKRGDITYQGVKEGVHTISGYGSRHKIISDEEMLTYGWCFTLNGRVPETLPHETRFTSQSDKLVWFYAYAHYLRGEWLSWCVPANRPIGK